MAAAARKYLPGYTGTCTIDGNSNPIQGWQADPDAGLWDTTTQNSGGWMEQEPGIQKVDFTFTVLVKAGTNNAPTLPAFTVGQVFAAVFNINGVAAYQGEVIITGTSVKCDIKGGVTVDCKATSQGPMTGSMAQAVVVPTNNSGGSGSGS